MHYGRGIITIIVVIGIAATIAAPPAAAQTPLRIAVALAERAEAFGQSGVPGSFRAEPGKAVLVVTVRGFENEPWDNISPRKFEVAVENTRYACVTKMGATISGGKSHIDYRLVFEVPRSATSFVLHYGDVMVRFTATGPVKPSIQ